jgi:hypothetical protein
MASIWNYFLRLYVQKQAKKMRTKGGFSQILGLRIPPQERQDKGSYICGSLPILKSQVGHNQAG